MYEARNPLFIEIDYHFSHQPGTLIPNPAIDSMERIFMVHRKINRATLVEKEMIAIRGTPDGLIQLRCSLAAQDPNGLTIICINFPGGF